jgi:hypothetical protein
MGHRGWCAVGGFTDRAGAEPTLGALRSSGIDAVATEERPSSSDRDRPGAQVRTWVLVPSGALEEAHEVLDRLAVGPQRRGPRDRGWPPWVRRVVPIAALIAAATVTLALLLLGS